LLEAANTLGTKIDEIGEEYQIKEKLNGVGDVAEEKFTVLSGAYR
jgi:hypothetical protein